jgi:hypothetical protein
MFIAGVNTSKWYAWAIENQAFFSDAALLLMISPII